MSFQSIRDQDVPVRLLRNMLARDRVPNGLLFWGPGGVGKRLVAQEMAKAIHCAQGDADACDRCLSCRKVANGNHPDVTTIAPVKKSRIIDVETVHFVNEMAWLRPFESQWRVFIIQEADRMGLPAQNHFLKTLEEPPGNSLFILLTEYPGLLLPTIASRCQRVRFGTLRPETVADLLQQGHDLEPEVARSIAALAQGQMSRALDLVESDKRAIVLDLTRRLAEGADPLELAEVFAKHLNEKRAQVNAAVEEELGPSDPADASREDREELKKQRVAFSEAIIRRDIMDYLYLFQTWYRDQAVFGATQDETRVLHRDQLVLLAKAVPVDLDSKLGAIEKARLYLERFLNEERVFRDLFFALAS